MSALEKAKHTMQEAGRVAAQQPLPIGGIPSWIETYQILMVLRKTPKAGKAVRKKRTRMTKETTRRSTGERLKLTFFESWSTLSQLPPKTSMIAPILQRVERKLYHCRRRSGRILRHWPGFNPQQRHHCRSHSANTSDFRAFNRQCSGGKHSPQRQLLPHPRLQYL